MKVDILAGGSGGNVIAVRSSQTTVLVDVGIAKTKVEQRLLDVGIRPDAIRAILVTHAHIDHTKGIPFANKYNIPVYAGEGEWRDIKGLDDSLKRPIKAGSDINIDDWYIETFKTHHDAMDPVGYVISDYEGFKCSICLDTGHVDDDMIAAMQYSNIYVIESNHDPNMVEVSDYPPATKARILSHIGHLSNQQTAEALTKLINGIGEQIYLTHLSHKNNMPALAEMTAKRALARKGLKAGTHYQIEVI